MNQKPTVMSWAEAVNLPPPKHPKQPPPPTMAPADTLSTWHDAIVGKGRMDAGVHLKAADGWTAAMGAVDEHATSVAAHRAQAIEADLEQRRLADIAIAAVQGRTIDPASGVYRTREYG